MRVLAALLLAALFVGCTTSSDSEKAVSKPTGPAASFERYGLNRLPDDRLIGAIPEGFDLDEIKRNPTQFRRKGWVTVGVRLHPHDVYFARAIFYILGSPQEARRMYERQSRMTRAEYGFLKSGQFLKGSPIPRPFEVDGVRVDNICGVRSESLYWCHAWKGRLYLLTQSSTATDGSRRVAAGTERHAGRLLKGFAALLKQG